MLATMGQSTWQKCFDYWMLDQGFIERHLRDLISRRHETKEVTLTPTLPVIQAIKNMRFCDISQIAVIDSQGQEAS